MSITRAAPSGKRLVPVDPLGLDDWNVGGPLTLELVAAGHAPGVYSFSISIFPVVTASAGTLTVTCSYDGPGLGPTSIVYQNAGTLNNGFIAPRHVMSSGLGPIRLALTPAGVTGSPRFYVNCPLDLMLARFPEDFP